jgi:hypothetical protein
MVAAAGKQAVENGPISPFQIEAIFVSARQLCCDLGQSHRLPVPPAHQNHANFADEDRLGLTCRMGIQNFDFPRKAQATAQQAVELPAFLQEVEPADSVAMTSWRTVLPRRTLRAIGR